ncbi:rhodoquinone biosynthesis methyltransferase RquA [Uliginosibacterium sediminicola]|uniref:Rhodoquinone biosynthesis methyltransferase RquA n=1 Tax=Uliginosibacterium sediminicola TaxID=2024550 RepID=A0ABU9Z095_9RHOO
MSSIESSFKREIEHPAPQQPALPAYMTDVYDWAYVSPRWVRWLDRNSVVRTLLFGNDQRLMQAYLERIEPGMHVWQVAHVYGDLVRRAAQRCGSEGHFTLTDVTPIQLEHAHRKLDDMPWAQLRHADAGQFRVAAPCDLICSFFLLHEVPDNWKRRIVDNILSQLPENAEALFVDYHKPAWWQPVRYILKWVNRLLEPFADALWQHEIRHYASHAEDYDWHKRTIFGGVYQIVSARPKARS